MASPSLKTEMYKCDYGRTPLLTFFNYPSWSEDMEFFFMAVDALDIVLGDRPRPTTAGRAANEYRSAAGKAAAMIRFSCHFSVKPFINKMRDPVEMWETLKSNLDTARTIR